MNQRGFVSHCSSESDVFSSPLKSDSWPEESQQFDGFPKDRIVQLEILDKHDIPYRIVFTSFVVFCF